MLKGNVDKNHKILDAGCGRGRNHFFFAKMGFDLWAFDRNSEALSRAKSTASALNIDTDSRFLLAEMESIPFDNECFDWVFNIAVLHFAKDKMHFEKMLSELFRVCKKGGRVLIRTATDIGIDHLIKPLGNQRFLLPDGTERFLLSEGDLQHYTQTHGAELFEPLKTTNVQNVSLYDYLVFAKGLGPFFFALVPRCFVGSPYKTQSGVDLIRELKIFFVITFC